VRWPNQPPTLGIEAHEQEALAFFKMFPDQHLVNNPYKVMIAQRDWTCTVAEFTGTMKGPMTMADGKEIAPTEQEL
jgi:SnoaL-like polyketide cyclase